MFILYRSLAIGAFQICALQLALARRVRRCVSSTSKMKWRERQRHEILYTTKIMASGRKCPWSLGPILLRASLKPAIIPANHPRSSHSRRTNLFVLSCTCRTGPSLTLLRPFGAFTPLVTRTLGWRSASILVEVGQIPGERWVSPQSYSHAAIRRDGTSTDGALGWYDPAWPSPAYSTAARSAPNII